MKNKFILILFALCIAACAAIGCAPDKTKPSESETPTEGDSLPHLEFTQSKIELLVGDVARISVKNAEKGETFVYTVTDENVATVNENGEAEGKGVGSAVIKAVSDLGRSGLVRVSVYDPENYPVPHISVKQNGVNLFVGDRFEIEYTHSYLGKTVDGTTEMTSGDATVATVVDGVVYAVAAGETTVTISVNSEYGVAVRSIGVTVKERETEFYPSFSGKDVYVGSPIELAIYVNENGTVKKIDGATFSVSDSAVAKIDGDYLVPLKGGETEISASFSYDGRDYQNDFPIHVYGPHKCSFTYIDGSVDYTTDALYGDVVELSLENTSGNPEYDKPIKCMYADGEEVESDRFVMPDKDVEVSVRFINETKDDFTKSFTAGFLLNNIVANTEYVREPFTDGKGNVSNLDGYVRFFTQSYGSAIYNFDEPVTVNGHACIRIRLYATDGSPLLYFGVPSEIRWPSDSDSQEYALKISEKRYEASPNGSASGDVPCQQIPNGEWTVLEMPLTAFADIGESLGGIAISSASIAQDGKYVRGGEILIDYISVDYGLSATDVTYQDKIYFNAITAEENGSRKQADAIGAYQRWSLGLTDEQRSSQKHIENVNAIRAVIEEHFTENVCRINDPIVSGARDAGNNHDGATGYHTEYKTTYETFHVVQFGNEPHEGRITLDRVNYELCQSAYFGLFVQTAGNGTVTVSGEQFGVDAKDHYFKVLISDGVLTVTDDSKNDADGGTTVLTANLPENVLNGTEGLVIDFDFDAWSQAEITEMYAVECAVTARLNGKPNVGSARYRGDQNVVGMGNVHTKYKTEYENFYMTQFDGDPYDGTFTFGNIDYSSVTEVYFGLYAISAGNGTIDIFGQKFTFDNSKEHYFKVKVKNGVLTVTDDSKNNADGGAAVLTVTLPEKVISGEEPLVISFDFTAWSQGENTDIYFVITADDVI